MNSMMNGRQRKNLGEQIDRLDSLLDGLAEGLNEAVATAVKEAVRAVLTEILSNPELLARLHATQAAPELPAESVVPSLVHRTAARARAAWQWLGALCANVHDRLANTACRLQMQVTRLLARIIHSSVPGR